MTQVSSPFVAANGSVGRVMRTVLYALLPGVAIYIWAFGWGILVNLALAMLSALVFEWLMLLLRERPVRPFLSDGSALVTAVLLALCLPPLTPWWVPVVGCFFAIVVAKHLYGGLGYNPFNPAMAAYAVLLVSFPRELSVWTAPLALLQQPLGLLETWTYVTTGQLPAGLAWDSLTAATPLDHLRTELGRGVEVAELSRAAVFGHLGGVGMEWANAGFLLGGLWLLYRRIITWHIPVAVLLSLGAAAAVGHVLDPAGFASPMLHLWAGAAILGAFFIATDPVTAAATPRGRLIYGCGIGLLSFAIRAWGGYPDGVAFAVLLMGLTVPLLDQYTTPRVYGARTQHGKQG